MLREIDASPSWTISALTPSSRSSSSGESRLFFWAPAISSNRTYPGDPTSGSSGYWASAAFSERGAQERQHVVGLRIPAQHRLREHELAVDVHVEDPAVSGHDLQRREDALPLVENSSRQTGGVRQRPSGDAVLDPHPMRVGHGRIFP